MQLTQLGELLRLPGIERAASSSIQPFFESSPATSVHVARASGWTGDAPPAALRKVSAEFFDVMNIRLVEGRWPASGEWAIEQPVAIVSETAARMFWPGRSAVGQLLVSGNRQDRRSRAVIAVVGDTRYAALDREGYGDVYTPDRFEPGVPVSSTISAPKRCVSVRAARGPDSQGAKRLREPGFDARRRALRVVEAPGAARVAVRIARARGAAAVGRRDSRPARHVRRAAHARTGHPRRARRDHGPRHPSADAGADVRGQGADCSRAQPSASGRCGSRNRSSTAFARTSRRYGQRSRPPSSLSRLSEPSSHRCARHTSIPSRHCAPNETASRRPGA